MRFISGVPRLIINLTFIVNDDVNDDDNFFNPQKRIIGG
jgi:hypothetical protein